MAKKRNSFGQLVETQEDVPLKDKIDQYQIPDVATTVSSAVQSGATPDQAKMAATRKEPVIQERVAKEETLAGFERLKGPEQLSPEEKERMAVRQKTAETLKGAGSLANRLMNKAKSAFDLQSQALEDQTIAEQAKGLIGEVTDDDLVGVPENLKETAKTEINAYLTGEKTYEEVLASLANQGLTTAQVEGILDTAAGGSVEEAALAAIPGAADMTISTLGIDDATRTDLATALGIDDSQLQGMTVEQLMHAVESTQQAEFDQMNQLMAQLDALPEGSARRELLEKQLRALGHGGQAALDAQFDAITQDVAENQVIRIGGKEYTTEELLSDSNISSVVEKFLQGDDDVRAEIREQYGEDFTNYITNNEAALSQLATDQRKDIQAFEGVQAEWDEFQSTIPDTFTDADLKALSPAYADILKNGNVTQAQLDQVKADLADSPVLGADDTVKAALTPELITEFNKKDEDGNYLYTAEDIKNAKTAAEDLKLKKANYSSILGDLMPEDAPFLTGDALKNYSKAKKVNEFLDDAGQPMLHKEGWFQQLSPEEKLGLINEDGTPKYTGDELKGVIDTYKDLSNYSTALEGATTEEEALEVIFGGPVDKKLLQDKMNKLAAYAKVNPDAQAQLDSMLSTLNISSPEQLSSMSLEHLQSLGSSALKGLDLTKPFSTLPNFDSSAKDNIAGIKDTLDDGNFSGIGDDPFVDQLIEAALSGSFGVGSVFTGASARENVDLGNRLLNDDKIRAALIAAGITEAEIEQLRATRDQFAADLQQESEILFSGGVNTNYTGPSDVKNYVPTSMAVPSTTSTNSVAVGDKSGSNRRIR